MERPHPVYIMYRVLTMAIAGAAAPAVSCPSGQGGATVPLGTLPYVAPALKERI